MIGYELFTGRHPFWHGDVAACLDAIQHRDPKPIRQIDDTIPSELERIVLKCLAKQLIHRYATATDVAVDLRRCRKSRRGRLAYENMKAQVSTLADAADTVPTGV